MQNNTCVTSDLTIGFITSRIGWQRTKTTAKHVTASKLTVSYNFCIACNISAETTTMNIHERTGWKSERHSQSFCTITQEGMRIRIATIETTIQPNSFLWTNRIEIIKECILKYDILRDVIVYIGIRFLS